MESEDPDSEVGGVTPENEKLAEYRDAFTLFDNVGDGKIDSEQIGDLLRSLNLNPDDADIVKIEKEVGDRRIKFEEFLSIFMREKQRAKEGSVMEFIETLSVFDKDNAGRVPAGELRHVLTALGNRLRDKDVDVLFTDCGEQGGMINTSDFVNMILSN